MGAVLKNINLNITDFFLKPNFYPSLKDFIIDLLKHLKTFSDEILLQVMSANHLERLKKFYIEEFTDVQYSYFYNYFHASFWTNTKHENFFGYSIF